jgi:hypothetical protein
VAEWHVFVIQWSRGFRGEGLGVYVSCVCVCVCARAAACRVVATPVAKVLMSCAAT